MADQTSQSSQDMFLRKLIHQSHLIGAQPCSLCGRGLTTPPQWYFLEDGVPATLLERKQPMTENKVETCGHRFHTACLCSLITEPDFPAHAVACNSCKALRTFAKVVRWDTTDIESTLDRVKQLKHRGPCDKRYDEGLDVKIKYVLELRSSKACGPMDINGL